MPVKKKEKTCMGVLGVKGTATTMISVLVGLSVIEFGPKIDGRKRSETVGNGRNPTYGPSKS